MEINPFNKTKIPKNKSEAGGVRVWQTAALMLISAALAAALVIITLLSGKTKYAIVNTADETDAGLISAILKQIDKNYYFRDKAPADRELLDIAAKKVVESLDDPYSAYFSEEGYNDFQNQINGTYKGIGVLVSFLQDKGLKVERSYEGNPAYTAGIRDGDIIIKVDDTALAGLDFDSANALLRGRDASAANVTVLRNNEEMRFAVKRGDVEVKRVYTEMLENEIGYLRIESFTGNADKEFDEALDALLAGGAGALIIDLRNNPGGYLDIVVKICDRILPECTITTVEGKMSAAPEVFKSTAAEALSIPFAVLVNNSSASASEIFASAVQDNKAGAIIGTNTFGKGIVQSNLALGKNMGYLKLTTDVYKTPNGRLIHGIGVAPDIEIRQADELMVTNEAGTYELDPYFIMRDHREQDLALKAAIEFLRKP